MQCDPHTIPLTFVSRSERGVADAALRKAEPLLFRFARDELWTLLPDIVGELLPNQIDRCKNDKVAGDWHYILGWRSCTPEFSCERVRMES
jgi:hypothetical protein